MTGFLMSVGRLHRLLQGTQWLLLHSEKNVGLRGRVPALMTSDTLLPQNTAGQVTV